MSDNGHKFIQAGGIGFCEVCHGDDASVSCPDTRTLADIVRDLKQSPPAPETKFHSLISNEELEKLKAENARLAAENEELAETLRNKRDWIASIEATNKTLSAELAAIKTAIKSLGPISNSMLDHRSQVNREALKKLQEISGVTIDEYT